jgi:FixJ family two-component response regulator
MTRDVPYRVLLIDDDADVASVVLAILTDDGYAVSTLVDTSHDSILAAVGRQEPDCVLLDGSSRTEYGSSWADAAYLAARERSIPTIMFTAHAADVLEAREAESERARAADFAAVLEKPFSLDQLLDAVATACHRSEPFNQSPEGDRERTVALARRLRTLGATDIRTSDRREWATFRPKGDDSIRQLYWWQRMGLYLVGAYEGEGELMPIGQFFELDAAVAAALANHRREDDERARPTGDPT